MTLIRFRVKGLRCTQQIKQHSDVVVKVWAMPFLIVFMFSFEDYASLLPTWNRGNEGELSACYWR